MLTKLFTWLKTIKKDYILSNSSYWYIEADWEASWEMDYTRSPRQFLKNKYYDEYKICSIYYKKPFTIQEAVDRFMIKYKDNTLLDDRLLVIQKDDRERTVTSISVEDSKAEMRDKKLEQLLGTSTKTKKSRFGW